MGQHHWVSGHCPSSRILNNYKTFWKLDLFPSSGDGVEETTTLLGPLERGDLSDWYKSQVQL
jgi:hypothetical protein